MYPSSSRVTPRTSTWRSRACALFASGAMVVAGLAATPQSASAAAPLTFHVATTGSDATGAGTSSAPWASVQKARDYIRTNRLNADMSDDIVVSIAAGTYYQTSTIEFTASDSGSNGHNIIYKNSGALGSAHFVGGTPLTDWSVYTGNIYRTRVNAGTDFSTLYENGVRAQTARTPNRVPNPNFPLAQAPYLRSEDADESRTVLQYKSGDLDPSSWGDLDDAQVQLWSGGSWAWFTDTVPIASIDTVKRQITLEEETRYPIVRNDVGSRYFVQGALAFLDFPGEFYLDRSDHYLYYYPRHAGIDDQVIVAPHVTRLVSLVGASATTRVHHIVLDGLTLEMTDFTHWYRHGWVNAGDSGEGHEYPAYDRQVTLPQHRTGMVYLENADHLTITNSHLTNAGYSAVFTSKYNQNHTISNNWIDHAGNSGIFLEGNYPGEGDVVKNNALTNNNITQVGELVGNGGGVYLMNSSGNTVSYSEVSESPRYAVTTVGQVDIDKEDIYVRNNVVKNVRMHHASQDSGDTAPLYAFGISDDKPYLTNTWEQITVSHARADPSMRDYAPNGVYMDNDSYGQTFKNVELSDTAGSAFHNNDSGSHSQTNVSWASGFDKSAMDYANIGVRSTFPWPVAPTDVVAAASGPNSVAVTWQQIRNAQSYDVLRASTPGGPYTKICSAVTSTSCTDTAQVGVGYYAVTSKTASGLVSAPSRESKVDRRTFDGFENGTGGWVTRAGAPSTSTTQNHSGAASFIKNEDREVLSRTVAPGPEEVATLWFYDDASDTSLEGVARVDNSTWEGGNWRGMGLNTGTSTTKYVTRIDSTWAATGVTRTTGWHELRWDYSSGSGVTMFIDGTPVATSAGVTTFSQVAMGDWWADGNNGTVYFDDWRIPKDAEGFESGVDAWTTRAGTPTTSTTQKHSGAQSFISNEDREVISRPVTAGDEKVQTVWLYDDASDTTLEAIARVDNTSWDGSAWRGMGVKTPTSTTHYVTRVNGTWAATSVARSTGWHELRWDYSSGSGAKMYIDGQLVASPQDVNTFSQIAIGDWWSNEASGNGYFDDAEN